MAAHNASPSFHCSLGTITGYTDGPIIRATGIPYATAGRFEKPQPVKRYDDPLDATRPSPACPQIHNPTLSNLLGFNLHKEMETSEDCLHLSVIRPNNEATDLPVMVWIHGGSYILGAGDTAYTDPKNLVAEQQVIVVSITYRLGIFGFLGGYNDIPPNLGYLDLWEALRWVNKHIHAFGGAPDNVCLFGQSAGGDAIAQLMLIKGTKGLFQKVIIQSAPFGIIRNKQSMIGTMQQEAKTISKDASVQALIRKQQDIMKATARYGFKSGMPFGAQYGAYPFPEERNIDHLWQERARALDLMVGYCKDETAFFIAFVPALKTFLKIPLLGSALKSAGVALSSWKIYKKGARKFARNCSHPQNNVYAYEIVWGSNTRFYGAMHSIDLPLLFWEGAEWATSQFIKNLDPAEIDAKGKKLRKLWADFARSGQLPTNNTIDDVIRYKRT